MSTTHTFHISSPYHVHMLGILSGNISFSISHISEIESALAAVLRWKEGRKGCVCVSSAQKIMPEIIVLREYENVNVFYSKRWCKTHMRALELIDYSLIDRNEIENKFA